MGDLMGHAERGDGEQSLYRFNRVVCMLSTSACLVGATCAVLIRYARFGGPQHTTHSLPRPYLPLLPSLHVMAYCVRG